MGLQWGSESRSKVKHPGPRRPPAEEAHPTHGGTVVPSGYAAECIVSNRLGLHGY